MRSIIQTSKHDSDYAFVIQNDYKCVTLSSLQNSPNHFSNIPSNIKNQGTDVYKKSLNPKITTLDRSFHSSKKENIITIRDSTNMLQNNFHC